MHGGGRDKYTIKINAFHNGSNLKTKYPRKVSLDDAIRICLELDDCVGFSYNKKANSAYFHKKIKTKNTFHDDNPLKPGNRKHLNYDLYVINNKEN